MKLQHSLAITALAIASAPSWAGLVIVNDNTNPIDTSSVSDLLLASGMAGMQVTLTSLSGATSTQAWAATGASSGSAVSTDLGGWQLMATGNTFASLWQFSYAGTAGLASLTLDGLPGSVLFDRATPTPGTAGSFHGSDFGADLDNDGLTDDPSWTVTYSSAAGLSGAAPVGDLFGRITIQFNNSQSDGFFGHGFNFLQDTDRFTPADGGGGGGGGGTVPEPASGWLVGLSLALAGAQGLRKRVA